MFEPRGSPAGRGGSAPCPAPQQGQKAVACGGVNTVWTGREAPAHRARGASPPAAALGSPSGRLQPRGLLPGRGAAALASRGLWNRSPSAPRPLPTAQAAAPGHPASPAEGFCWGERCRWCSHLDFGGFGRDPAAVTEVRNGTELTEAAWASSALLCTRSPFWVKELGQVSAKRLVLCPLENRACKGRMWGLTKNWGSGKSPGVPAALRRGRVLEMALVQEVLGEKESQGAAGPC